MQTSVDLRKIISGNDVKSTSVYFSSSHPWIRVFLPRKITHREKSEFCTQLSVMLQARISLHRALEVLIQQARKPGMKIVLKALENEIQKGNSFAKALAMQPYVFDQLFIVTAEVGQESGRLAEVLAHHANHLEKMSALRRKFTQALSYPALVLGVACCAITFLLVFIVPTFAEMFTSAAGGQFELPLSTRIILHLSGIITHYGLYASGVAVVAAFIFWKSVNREKTKRRLESFLLKVPLVGGILVKNHVALFCRTLGTLLQAQVSLLEALEVSRRIMKIPQLQHDIGGIIRHVRRGTSIAEPLVGSTLFPPMVAQMIAVGEESSELDKMLLHVADFYEKELDSVIEKLSSLIEPLLILFLGLIVGAILISMYLPMFDLVNVVGNG